MSCHCLKFFLEKNISFNSSLVDHDNIFFDSIACVTRKLPLSFFLLTLILYFLIIFPGILFIHFQAQLLIILFPCLFIFSLLLYFLFIFHLPRFTLKLSPNSTISLMVPVIPNSPHPSLIFPLHLSPIPVYLTGFSFYSIFTVFILLSSNNNKNGKLVNTYRFRQTG